MEKKKLLSLFPILINDSLHPQQSDSNGNQNEIAQKQIVSLSPNCLISFRTERNIEQIDRKVFAIFVHFAKAIFTP